MDVKGTVVTRLTAPPRVLFPPARQGERRPAETQETR